MRIVWKEILEGWRNDLFPPEEIKDKIRQTQEQRLNICKRCPFNSTPNKINNISYCKDCGCPLKKKSACLHCECPQQKWFAELTEEEVKTLKTKNNQNESY